MQYLYKSISKRCSIFEIKAQKGFKMSLIIKNAETLFEKFEIRLEKWAEKLF